VEKEGEEEEEEQQEQQEEEKEEEEEKEVTITALKNAAVCIQSCFRGHQARVYASFKRFRHNSATTMHSLCRSYIAKKRLKELKVDRRRHTAATIIAAHARRRHAQKRLRRYQSDTCGMFSALPASEHAAKSQSVAYLPDSELCGGPAERGSTRDADERGSSVQMLEPTSLPGFTNRLLPTCPQLETWPQVKGLSHSDAHLTDIRTGLIPDELLLLDDRALRQAARRWLREECTSSEALPGLGDMSKGLLMYMDESFRTLGLMYPTIASTDIFFPPPPESATIRLRSPSVPSNEASPRAVGGMAADDDTFRAKPPGEETYFIPPQIY
jgi:hypothetical protein